LRAAVPLFVTLAVQAMISMAALSGAVLAPDASRSTGFSEDLIGIFIGIIYAAAMASSLASGSLVGRFGPIRVSQFALLLAAAGLAIAADGRAPSLAFGAIAIGLGYGVVTPASSHLLARTTPPHRLALTFSLKQTGVPLGGALAGLILPALALAIGWQGAAFAVALASIAAALLAQLIRRQLDSDREPGCRISIGSIASPLLAILRQPALRGLALCSFGFAAMQLVLTGYLVVFLTKEVHLPLVAAGALLAVAQAAGVGGRLLWGWVADQFVPPSLLLPALGMLMAACALGFAAIGPAWPVWAIAAISAVFGATAIGWNGVFLAEVARVAPRRDAGAATGGALFLTYFGVVTGPPAFALTVDWASAYTGGFFIFGLLLVLLSGLLAAARPSVSQGQKGTQP
jgi:MFS family permease